MANGRLKVREIAEDAKKAGCGNCGEQSAIAWVYLHDERGITPVDWVVDQEYFDAFSHAFVVVGRKEGSDISRPETWGKDAAVCDPWNNKCYLASELKRNMGNTNLVLWIRD